MTYLFAVGVTVGILAGAWVYAGGTFGFVGFAGFLGWATYFAAGGGKKGIISTLCSNLSGVFWGVITIWAATTFTAVPSLFFTVAFAAIMCWQAKLNLLEFIPGTFIGNAAFYAAGNDAIGAAVGLTCGAVLGLLSDFSAKKLSAEKSDNTIK